MTAKATTREKLRALGIYLLLIIIVVGVVLAARSARNSERSAKSSDRSAQAAEDAAKGVQTLLKDRVAETDRRRTADLAAAAEKTKQDAHDAELLKTLSALVTQMAATQKAIQDCTTPTGVCARQGAQRVSEALRALQEQHNEQLQAIKSIEFRVTGTVGGGQFEGIARPTSPSPSPTCPPVIGVGGAALTLCPAPAP